MTHRDRVAVLVTVGDIRLPPRFWSKILVRPDGCWIWTAGMRRGGYGRIRVGGKGSPTTVAHRFAYERLFGPVPDRLQLDHLCRNRACANPSHVEPVSSRENTLRGETPAALNAAKTQCPVGHEYDEKNTLMIHRRGRIERFCRACGRERMRKRRAQSKGVAA